MQIPFVGFQPVKTSEHMASAGVFALLQVGNTGDLNSEHMASAGVFALLQVGNIRDLTSEHMASAGVLR